MEILPSQLIALILPCLLHCRSCSLWLWLYVAVGSVLVLMACRIFCDYPPGYYIVALIMICVMLFWLTPTSLIYDDDDGDVIVDGDVLVMAVEAPSSGVFVLVLFELHPWKFSSFRLSKLWLLLLLSCVGSFGMTSRIAWGIVVAMATAHQLPL